MESLEDRRLLAAGDLDPTFGDGGKVLTDIGYATNDMADVVAVAQPDGKFLVAGDTYHGTTLGNFFVLRYNMDGSLDTSFGVDGVASIDFGSHNEGADAMAVDGDGRIIVAGFSQQGNQHDFAVARLTDDGALDTSFSGDGKLLYDFAGLHDVVNDVAIDDANRIVLAGYTGDDMAVIRLEESGILDTSFNGTGVRQLDFGGSSDIANAVAIDAEGQILLAGSAYDYTASESDFIVVRLTDTGAFDTDFDEDGIQEIAYTAGSNDFAHDLTIDPGGRIVVAGYTYDYSTGDYTDFAVVRLMGDGALDTSFDGDGKQTLDFDGNYDYAYSVAIDSFGRVVLMGGSWGSVNAARLLSNGSFDASFGKQTIDFGSGRGQFGAGLVDGQDRVLIVGRIYGESLDIGLVRLDADGALDKTFGEGGHVVTDIGTNGTHDYGYDVAVQPDGKIVVVGSLYAWGAPTGTDFAVARYNSDGSLDTTFGNAGKAYTIFGGYSAVANSVAIQDDGKIVVAGYTDAGYSGGHGNFAVARYNSDGTPDSSFHYDGKVTTDFDLYVDQANDLAIQSDGKIVVVGYSWQGYESSGGTGLDFAIARYNIDGTLDTNFDGDGKVTTDFSGLDDRGYSVAIDSSGNIVVGGDSVQGSPTWRDFAVARYNGRDGSLDTTFGQDLNGDGLSDGKLTTDFGSNSDYLNDLTIDADGRIVVVGYIEQYGPGTDFALARYNSADGSLDPAFGTGGKVITDLNASYDRATGVAVDAYGKIVVAGYSYQGFALTRYNGNGSLDTTFGTAGKATTDFGSYSDEAQAVAIDATGKIVLAGYSYQDSTNYDFALARYEADFGVGTITAPTDPVEVHSEVIGSAFFTDRQVSRTHTATWDWGDGSFSGGSVNETAGTVTGSHAYTAPGVYTVKLTVDASEGGTVVDSDQAVYQYVVAFDPSAGFVTGGGTIDSPAGAWTAQPWLTGPATFAFVSKYQKGANTPDGTTVFRFRTADLDFMSSSYEWMVVAGAHAKFKGTGTVGGSGEYGFMITATDGQANKSGVDELRIKIWDATTDTIVYDNRLDEADDSYAGTAISAGNIIVHSGARNLLGEHPIVGAAPGSVLTASNVQPFVDRAIAHWQDAGYQGVDLQRLRAVEFHLADFADNRLGATSSSTNIIWLDTDAAGYGWYTGLEADQVATVAGGYDLLTVITHELGHVVGLEDLHSARYTDHVMSGVLLPGSRRVGPEALTMPWLSYDPWPSVRPAFDSVDGTPESGGVVSLKRLQAYALAPFGRPARWDENAVDHLFSEADRKSYDVLGETENNDGSEGKEEGHGLERRLTKEWVTVR